MTFSVAIVPARKGSTAFPNKNLSLVNGISLIEHTLVTARQSNIFDFILITTDYSLKELGFSLEKNEILHARSDVFASSSATATDVLRDFLQCEECSNVLRDAIVCYLQPTSPLRTSIDIVKSGMIAEGSSMTRCLSLSTKAIVPEKLMMLNNDRNCLIEFQAGKAASNRQDNASYYLPNGAIYWFKYQDFLQNDTFPLEGATPYFMSEINSIDIDRFEDLEQVQMMMEARNG
jgi:CMP-N,N'-diacetyllegionaminic acid synthase